MKDFTVDLGGLRVVGIVWLVVIVFITAIIFFPEVIMWIMVIILVLILVGSLSFLPYMMYVDNKKWKKYGNSRNPAR